MTTANSWSSRPTMPPMNSTGRNTAASDSGHRDDGEADLARAVQRRLHAPLAHLHVADDVLEHHDGVVDDEAHGERQRHQREVVDRVAQHVHDHERADDGHGQGQARDDGRRDVPQEEEDDQDDEGDGEEQGELHVVHGVADRDRAVVEDAELHRGGQLGLERGEDLADRVHHLDGVGAGLALDGEDHRPVVVVPARDLVGLHAVDDAPELLEADGRAVAIGDDQRPVGGGIGELAGGLDGEGLVRPVQRAGGQVDVRLGERLLHLVDADAAAWRARSGSSWTRTAYFCEPKTCTWATPLIVEMRCARLVCGVLVHRVERQGRRAERQVQDRAGRPGSPSCTRAASACPAAAGARRRRWPPARPGRRRRCCARG